MSILKPLYIIGACLLLASCTVYTIKQSEILSESVYYANDSFDKGRFDITDRALSEAIRVVKPPKNRLSVGEITQSITSNTTTPRIDSLGSDSGKNKHSGQRVIIVPERFKGMTVVVINSDEYAQLLKDKKVFLQLQQDYKNLKDLQKKIDDELIREQAHKEKLILDNTSMQRKIVEKDFAIMKRNVITVVLVLVIAGGIYLRIKGIL